MNYIDSSVIQAFARDLYTDRATGQVRPFILTPYSYPVNFGDIAALAQATQQLSITANADFIFTALRYQCFATTADAGAVQTSVFVPSVSLLITDQGSNEQYMSSAVKLASYGFNSQQLGTLPFPRFIAGRTALTFQATNDDTGASVFGLQIALEGALVRQL